MARWIFKVVGGFEVSLVEEFTLVLVNVKGFCCCFFFFWGGGGRGAERIYRFKQVFPSDINS